MIFNYLGTVLFISAAWITGLTALKLTGIEEKGYRFYSYISIPVGITIYAVTATLIYLRLGLPISAVRLSYALLALVSVAILRKKKVNMTEIKGLTAQLLLFTIMLLPGIFCGEKYYVHRGNIYDHYFYLSEVVYMCLQKLSYGWKEMPNITNVSEILTAGFAGIHSDRPTTPLLCASLAARGWGSIFFQAYLYLIMVWSATWGAFMFAMELFTKGWKSKSSSSPGLLQGILSILYLWGFYGQIQYDINAWSQLTAMGSLLAYVCIYLLILADLLKSSTIGFRQYLLLWLMGVGLFLIYPENTMIHGALLLGVSLCLWLGQKSRLSGKSVAALAALPLLIVAVSALLDFSAVRFAVFQVNSAGDDIRQSWASYFNRYWLGYFPYVDSWGWRSGVKKLIAFIPSVFGMFLLAPDYGLQTKVLKFAWMSGAILVICGIFILLGKQAVRIRRQWAKKEAEYNQAFLLMTVMGMAIFLFMLLEKKYWSAGKLLLYVSPYIYLVMVEPFFRFVRERERSKGITASVTVVISCLFLACQMFMTGMRAYDAAANPDGTGYLGNYPSDQMPYLKEKYPYGFHAENYRDTATVAVNIDDNWYQDYIEIALTYEGIPFYVVPDYIFQTKELRDIQPAIREGDMIIQP